MKKINIKRFILIGLCVVLLGGCDDLKGDKIQIFLSQSDYQIGIDEPVFLDFVIKNDSDRIIEIDLGQNSRGGFLFTVVSPDGKETEIPRFIKDGISSIGKVTIRPQQMHSRRLLFNEWFKFESPGVYTIKGKLFYPVKSGEKKVKEIPDFAAVLDVKPKNLERLKMTSAILYRFALQTHGSEQKQNNARALGYVNDPVAVPYLERLLIADKMVDSIAINGLERIGGKASVEVLNKIVRRIPLSDRAMLSRAALKRMEKRESNSVVQK